PSLVVYSHRVHFALLSFPTRRSSDLLPRCIRLHSTKECSAHAPCIWRFWANIPAFLTSQIHPSRLSSAACRRRRFSGAARRATRSEEHTSELQSRFDLVCRLLLEKKN